MINKTVLFSILLLFNINIQAQQNWQELTPVVDGQVRALYTDTVNNILYIGGGFNYIDTTYARGITAYDGTTFHPLGFGIDWDGINSPSSTFPSPVLSITEYNGLLYAGGYFRMAGGIDVNGIACWNGTEWDTLNNGVMNIGVGGGIVYDLLVHNNELYASGMFGHAGGDTANSIAKWNDTTWTDVGAFPDYYGGNSIYVMAVYKDELYVGGLFQDSLGNPVNIARWDGTEWKTVGNGVIGQMSMVYALEVYNNELYAGGNFTTEDGNAGNFIMKWDGNNWSDVGGGVSDFYGSNVPVRYLYVHNNELYAGGDFNMAGGVPASHIAKWDGTEWCGFGNYINSSVMNITSFNDTLYIAGGFWTIDTTTIIRIAKWIGGDYVDTCGTMENVIKLQQESDGVIVYPNPTTGKITVQAEGIERIEIMNMQGKQIYTGIKNEIDLSNNSKGIYFIKVTTEKGVTVGKVVLE